MPCPPPPINERSSKDIGKRLDGRLISPVKACPECRGWITLPEKVMPVLCRIRAKTALLPFLPSSGIRYLQALPDPLFLPFVYLGIDDPPRWYGNRTGPPGVPARDPYHLAGNDTGAHCAPAFNGAPLFRFLQDTRQGPQAVLASVLLASEGYAQHFS